MKKLIFSLLCSALFQACSSTNHAYSLTQAIEAEPQAILSETSASQKSLNYSKAKASQANVLNERLIIYRADINLSVTILSDAHKQLIELSKSMGGWMQQSTNQSLTLRIPANFFEAFIEKLDTIGRIQHKNINAQDISERHRDLKIRLASSEKTLARLKELYKQAKNVTEILKIEAEINRVTTQLELFKGQLKALNHQVAYSTITIRLNPAVSQTRYQASFDWLYALANQLHEPLQAGKQSNWFSNIDIEWPENFVPLTHSKNFASALSSEGLFTRAKVMKCQSKTTLEFWTEQAKTYLDKACHMQVINEKSIHLKNGQKAQVLEFRQAGNIYCLILSSGKKELGFLEMWAPQKAMEQRESYLTSIANSLVFDLD